MRRLGILLATMVLTAIACTAADPSPTTTARQATTSTASAPAATTQPAPNGLVMVADSQLGSILVDGEGSTLYLFMPDNQGESVCYDQCESAWPPLVDDVLAGNGIDSALLGTRARSDGSNQVTYNGWPLYHFANDAAPGDTNGQGKNDAWYVVDPHGDPVGQPAAAGTDGY